MDNASLKSHKLCLEREKCEVTSKLEASKKKAEEDFAKVEAHVVAAESEVASTEAALNASLAREATLKYQNSPKLKSSSPRQKIQKNIYI